MKRVIIQSIANVLLYVLAAVLFSSIARQIVVFQDDPLKGTGFNLSLDLSIILPIVLLLVLLTSLGYFLRTNKTLGFSRWSTTTSEFSDNDERERFITGQATRIAYVSFLVSIPVVMVSFIAYPYFSARFPTFPFYALAAVLSIGTLSYMSAWIYYYKK